MRLRCGVSCAPERRRTNEDGSEGGQGVSPPPAKTAEETLKALGSNPAAGLADADARFAKEGPNEVPEKRRHPILRLAKKFWGISAWMIELIAVLSFFLHKRADMRIALGLLVANALLSFFQEQRASAAVAPIPSRSTNRRNRRIFSVDTPNAFAM
jgi:magnesium-transporting ATPase (P-type)